MGVGHVTSALNGLHPTKPMKIATQRLTLSTCGLFKRVHDLATTEGPSWGRSRVVLGAIESFLEPFGGIYRPKLTRSLGK